MNCFYCDTHPAEENEACQITLFRPSPGSQPDEARETKEVSVPRCRKCAWAHVGSAKTALGGGCLSAVVLMSLLVFLAFQQVGGSEKSAVALTAIWVVGVIVVTLAVSLIIHKILEKRFPTYCTPETTGVEKFPPIETLLAQGWEVDRTPRKMF